MKIVRAQTPYGCYLKVMTTYREIVSNQDALSEKPSLVQKYLDMFMAANPNLSMIDAMGQVSREFYGNHGISKVLPSAKIISCEFQSVLDAIESSQLHVSELNYSLPFPVTFLHLQKPLPIMLRGAHEKIIAFLLEQRTATKQILDQWSESTEELRGEILKKIPSPAYRAVANSLLPKISVPFASIQPSLRGKIEAGETIIVNCVSAIYDDMCQTQFAWNSDSGFELTYDESLSEGDEEVRQLHIQLKRIAVAVVGFINCENVALEKCYSPEQPVKSSTGRKKTDRPHYYVCKITKNFEPSEAEQDSTITHHTGSSHSFRYDVRGHFRRLSSGKTIWVKSHQRGVLNETYIPKQYAVDTPE